MLITLADTRPGGVTSLRSAALGLFFYLFFLDQAGYEGAPHLHGARRAKLLTAEAVHTFRTFDLCLVFFDADGSGRAQIPAVTATYAALSQRRIGTQQQ